MVSYNVTNVWGLIVFFLCSFALRDPLIISPKRNHV